MTLAPTECCTPHESTIAPALATCWMNLAIGNIAESEKFQVQTYTSHFVVFFVINTFSSINYTYYN